MGEACVRGFWVAVQGPPIGVTANMGLTRFGEHPRKRVSPNANYP